MTQPEGTPDAVAPAAFRRILVAYDGSPNAERALDAAVALAQIADSELTVLSVVPEFSGWMFSGGMGGPVDIPQLQDDAKRAVTADLDEAIGRLPADLTVAKLIEVGRPAVAIVERASSGDFDLVVVGSRGRGEAAALFLGSVSQHVAHGSEVPVLIVR